MFKTYKQSFSVEMISMTTVFGADGKVNHYKEEA